MWTPGETSNALETKGKEEKRNMEILKLLKVQTHFNSYFSDISTMQKVQNCRVPRWKFGLRNSDNCASHLFISNIQKICSLEQQWLQKELFKVLFYWPPPRQHIL